MNLRPYQKKGDEDINLAWGVHRNVAYIAPCRSGKTVLISKKVKDNRGASVVIAHRGRLIIQMSKTLSRNGVRHRVIGPKDLIRECQAQSVSVTGRNYVDPNSRCAVASVDTLILRDENDPWLKEVTLWVTDECHHITRKNKWGKAVEMLPNARGLGVTATFCRASGEGLGRKSDGVFDIIVEGPTMRELIDEGNIADYRIFAPPSDLDLSQVALGADGDFSPAQLRNATHKSHIVGDIVQHYLRITPGKLGMTFAVDIESATEIAQAYRNAGVPAEIVSGKTPFSLQREIERRHQNREIKQIVSVDLYGEGTDIPDLEVVSFGRATQSFGLFVQQFCRPLNPRPGKIGFILDHVGNVLRHGLPDAPRVWTLDRKDRRARSSPGDVIPVRICGKCLAAYERVLLACPYCGETPVPATRSAPEAVDGDLHEMSAELLAKLRSEAAAVDQAPKIPYGAKPEVVGAIKKRHRERQEAQSELRRFMALWGGWQETQGRSVRESQRRFFHGFGVDVATAQGLGRAEASELCGRIRGVLDREGVKGIDEVVNNE